MFDPEFYLHPVFWIVGGAFLLQLIWQLSVFLKLVNYKSDEEISEKHLPLSVVITAKDEVQNLRENLPHWLMQEHKNYELIIVNDQSEDGTDDLLKEYQQHFKHLKVVTIEPNVNTYRGKKLALTLAFKSAKNDILVLTDADCKPASKKWLTYMQQPFFNKETEIALGYSPYQSKNSFLNLLIRYETVMTAMQYFSFAIGGNPYMGVGRNLAYRKNLFFDNKGFAPYLHLPSGDDDLFVNKHATEYNIAVVLNPASFMVSVPETKWKNWFRQKHRHLSVGKHYKGKHKFQLGLLWMVNYVFYLSIILGCFFKGLWLPVAGILLIKMIVWMLIVSGAGKKLSAKYLWTAVPLMDIIYTLIYTPIMGLIGRFKKLKYNRTTW
ncbi:MAG: glycosyltransferase [Bacteroidetes bacterium]|nr:glycosyltransferase [Bacteroidota bacterium]